ncbi:MAG TPA: AsmA-like C-terminal region-containing protein [Chryseosolibacter sp.]|nr:AsmA-like C-terminal region-containing protein [Chryseosolibacter sp.]
MNKGLKWLLIIIGSVIILFLAAALIIPAVFKDDIKAIIEKEVAKSVNADVVFEDFDLSFFRHFPNITAGLDQLGVMNRAPFEGDVLFATEKFEVEVNIADLLFGDALRVKGITLVRPVINVKVLKDGRANYDIAMPSADTTATDSSEFSFGIDHWEIVNGDVTYDDRAMDFNLAIKGLNHSGSGDFTQDVFDMRTHTVADTVSTAFEGVEYLTNKRAEIDATLNISEDYSKYTFKDNTAKINDFAMHVDGWLKMNENDMAMDLTFSTPENTFKSLLSLVPGIYTKSFDDIHAEGDLAFKGFAKGTYSEKQLPAFNLTLLVKDASFKYPDLPTAVSNINVDLLVDSKDGNLEHTIVDLKKMHLDFGSNPVDARAQITRLYPTNVDAAISAKLNLAELNKMFPMEGLAMKGNYAIDLKAKGVYDSLKKLIPAVDANMSLTDGYVKSSDFPIPMDNIHFTSSIKNTSGRMADTYIKVNDFSMLMDGEKLTADLALQNLDNYTWDLKMNGGVDLEKITRIFPVEGMTLAGKVKANIQTKGNYADLNAERYDRLPTSGTASLQDFKYVTADLPPVSLASASMVFDPRKIALEKVNGTIGKSDFNVSGSLANYLGYVFGKNEVITGNVNFNSNLLDLNEFMSGEEETVAEDTSTYSTIEIPRNIDFLLRSNVKTAKFMDYTITNAQGDVKIKDGVANLDGLRFNMLGGSFVVNGTYNTKVPGNPAYDLDVKIDNLSIQQAASSFSVVKTFAPIAGLVNGKFSTDFKVQGKLLDNMMPNMATVDAGGLVKIAQASLKDSKLVSGITSLTKLKDTDNVTLKDVLMSASIDDGKLSVKPFDVNFGEYKTTVAGSTALDGTIDYNLKMNVPAGKLGSEFNTLLSKYSTQKTDPNSPIPVTIALGGKYNDPRPSLMMEEQKEQVKEAVKEAAKQEGTKAIEKAVKGTEAEKIVKDILGTSKTDTTKKSQDTATAKPATTQEAVKQKVEEEAKQKIQNLLKRKKN